TPRRTASRSTTPASRAGRTASPRPDRAQHLNHGARSPPSQAARPSSTRGSDPLRTFSLPSATILVFLALLASPASAQKARAPAPPPEAETAQPQEPPPPPPPDYGPDISAIRARLDQLEKELAAEKQRADAEAAARAEAEKK